MDPIVDPALLASLSPEDIERLWKEPALQPPLGVESNFDNPSGRHEIGYVVVILSATLTATAVALRLSSRCTLKRFEIEDGLFLTALGLHGGFLYPVYDLAIWPGFRVHQWNVRLEYMAKFLFHTHIVSIFYGLIIMLLKVSILLNWLRIFAPMHQRNAVFWVAHVLIWSNVLFYGIGTIVEIFQCTPREKIWNPVYRGGSCPIDMAKHMVASLVINWVSDVAILILPQKVIWKLQVSRGQKVGLSLLFAIGLFACVCATVRIIYMIKFQGKDTLYAGSELIFWMVAEVTAGFLVMGLPSLPKVFKCIPGSVSLVSFLQAWIKVGSGGQESNSRHGLPSWYKPASRRRPRLHGLDDMNSQDVVLVGL